MIKTTHKIIIGDSRVMNEVSDSSVHLVITSPPYWQLKDYGCKNQIGFDQSYEEYINHLNLVWNECYRVLYPGCRLCVNIGDQFARSVYYGRYKVVPIRTEIIKFCETIGFDYMGAIIWQKPTTMNTTGGASVMGSFPYPRNGIIKIDYEFILIFKKPGDTPSPSKEYKELSRLSKEEWNKYFSAHWNFNGERQQKHLATFPLELPTRLIKMFSFVGETVLDPFLGSGTSTLAAKNLNRNSIGYEINPDFISIIKEKLNINESNLWNEGEFEIIFQSNTPNDWDEKIQKLPYVFIDKVKFDKKINPKILKFGSKIDSSDLVNENKEKLFYVESILSPEELILNNNLKVKLIGIKSNKEYFHHAINFLQQKLDKQKVFIKFDKEKYDSQNNLLVYLYLKNKTFINAHLIKTGFVNVDIVSDYSLKDKFLRLKQQSSHQKKQPHIKKNESQE